MIRTYSELIKLPTFDERLKYLQLYGGVGSSTFGIDRIFNQKFYTSKEWRKLRNYIIVRDSGCDLGVKGCDIPEGLPIIIHHMNPITIDDISECSDILMNPEYLITTIHNTHNAIHYGVKQVNILPFERTPNDTCPWKR